MYFLVYAIFMCELQKIFFLRDMIDNQCANIFTTHATVYGSHSVMFAFIESENIFLHVYSQLNFLSLVCESFFPHLLIFPQNCFSQNMFCFSYFYRGKKVFFNLCCSQRELLLFTGGVASILYRARFFCFLDSLFALDFCCVCFCLLFV